MSDLQCAATVVVLAEASEQDVDRLRAERPAQVYAASDRRDAAESLARALAVGCRPLPEHSDAPGSLVPALDALADEYRGECLAVVVAPSDLEDLARLALPDEAASALVVRIDADGHRWAPWGLSGPTGR